MVVIIGPSDRQMEAEMTATTSLFGLLPSTSTLADGFGTLLGLGLFAVAAAFFILRWRTT